MSQDLSVSAALAPFSVHQGLFIKLHWQQFLDSGPVGALGKLHE